MSAPPPSLSTRSILIRRLALLGAVCLALWGLWAAVRGILLPCLAQRYVPESFLMLYGQRPAGALPDKPKGLPRRGHINGVPISVPLEYMHFPVEYMDKSIWEGPKPGDKRPEDRTFDDAIGAFTIYAHWPDMQPRNRENGLSFLQRDDGGEHPWILIGVSDGYIRSPRPPQSPDNGLARVLRRIMERLTEYPQDILDPSDPERKRTIKTTDLRYALRGADPATGLLWAEPVGPGTHNFHGWNMVLYWQGDKDAIVTDLIECYNGKLRNPRSFLKCRHQYELPEWKAYVAFTYPRSWLPHWRDLKARSRELVLSFAAPVDQATAPPAPLNSATTTMETQR